MPHNNKDEANAREPMDSVDHAWLRMEKPNNFMMIGVVLMFETPLDIPALKQTLQQRLVDRFVRFKQRVVHNKGAAYWELDEGFSLGNHLLSHSPLPYDGKTALQCAASEIMSTPLDFDKPLWSIHHIEGYQGGDALVLRIHHCIADGMSLVKLIISLTDEESTSGKDQLCMSKPTGGAGSRHHESLRDLIGHPSHLVDSFKHGLSGAEELAAVTLRPGDPKTLLKGDLSGQKLVAWSDPISLDDVKVIGKSFQATVNDLLMTAATGAIRSHLLRIAEDTDGKIIHAAVPFNLRPIDESVDKLGNEFGLVIVPLPIGIEDPLDRLGAVKQGMDKLKHSYQAHVFFFLLQVLGKGPSVLEQTALDVLSKKASIVMTNVPGPKKPLYLAGSKLVQPLAWVPQSGDIGIGLSILTYNDTVQFGVVADRSLISNLDEFSDLFTAEFRKLEMLIRGDLHVEE